MKLILLFLSLFFLSVQAQELKKASIQFQWKHQFEYAGFYAAIEQGYYRDVGLDVELKEVTKTTNLIDEVLQGKSDFGISYSSIVAEYYKGKPIVMMANIFKHSALVLVSQKDIFTPAELQNKVVMGGKVEISNTGLGMMLRHFDITIDDLNLVPPSHNIEDFKNKKVDAMTAFITNQPYQLNTQNIPYNILSPTNYGSQFYDVNIFTSQALLKRDPKMVRDFRDASIKGWHYALEHSDEIIQLILKKYNTQHKTFDALKYEAEITKSLILEDIYPLGSVDCNIIQNMKQNFIDLNIISKKTLPSKENFIMDHNCQTEKSQELTDDERAYLQKKKDIRVCSDPNWMPFEKIKEGKLVGMSADYLDLLQTQLNVPFTLVPTKNWSESLEFAKQRKCDIFSLAMQTPSRKKYMNFTKPHLSIPLVIATTNDKLFITDFQDSLNQTFGAVKGYAFTEILKLKYPKLKIIEYNSIQEGLQAVDHGKIYGFLDNLCVLAYHMQKEYVGSLKITGRIEYTWELGIGVRNDDPVLFNILNKTIDNIDEKKKQEILNSWTSISYEERTDFSLFWKFFALVTVIISILLYRYIEIQKYNKELTKLNKELEHLSITDGLTKLYNRRFLDDVLQNEYDRAQRYKNTFSLILIDIDDFKEVNDTYGHDKGDHVLRTIAAILKEHSRANDIVGRWGGEEFMVVCQNSKKEGAVTVAEKMRLHIQNHDFKLDRDVTASFGVLEYHPTQTYHWHITSVDKALYEAKDSGKNRIKVYQ